MKKDKQELSRIHKEKCKELKSIRARIAAELGVDLQQRECTYEGYCSGTCPKCMSEELKLNAAIMKKQLEDVDLKRRMATAGLTTVAALSLTGCNLNQGYNDMPLEGVAIPLPEESVMATSELEGDVMVVEPEVEEGVIEYEIESEVVEGGMAYEVESEEIEGDFEITSWPKGENTDGTCGIRN